MKYLFLAAFIFGGLPLAAKNAAAQTPSSKSPMPANKADQIRSRVAIAFEKLGSNDYATRQAAQAELIKIGLPALGAVTGGTTSPDAEVRSRCRIILKALEELKQKKAQQDLESNIALLVGDSWKDHRHEFPLWESYQELAGTSPAARQIFASVLHGGMKLLQTVESDPDEAAKLLEQRFEELLLNHKRGMHKDLSLGEITAILLASTTPEFVIQDKPLKVVAHIDWALKHSELPKHLTDSGKGPVLRKILAGWIRRNDRATVFTRLAKMKVATRYNVKQGLDVALALLRDPANQVYPHMIRHSIMTIAQFGDRQHLILLEPLLTSKIPAYEKRHNNVMIKTQLRDAALVAMIHITKQNPKQYGFSRIEKNTETLYTTASFGFPDSEERVRTEAIKKWRRWKAGQPRAKSPSKK